jgi:hypothetical protein
MKNSYKTLFFAYLSCAFALVAHFSAISQENNNEYNEHQQLAPNSRPMSLEKQMLMQEKRALEFSQNQGLQQEIEQHFKKIFPENSLQAENGPLDTPYFPLKCNWLEVIFGNSVQLGDGSTWKISSEDYSVITSWWIFDPLVISPVYNWFSSYHYWITNQRTGTYVQADLGPTIVGQNTRRVAYVDRTNGRLFLDNRIGFSLNPEDRYIFEDWESKDVIIIGASNPWFSSYDYVLINVNMNNCVRAKIY